MQYSAKKIWIEVTAVKNVILSQLYGLRKNRTVFLCCIGAVAIFTAMLVMTTEWTGTRTASESVASGGLGMMTLITGPLTAIITGIICADDFTDKTINHELTSGKMRMQSFFGRAVLAVTISVITTITALLVSLFIAIKIYGWGDTVTLDSAIIRIFLTFIPFFKLSCFGVMVAFILKQPYGVVLVFIGIKMMIGIMSMKSTSSMLMISEVNAGKLCMYENYITYGLNTDARFIYDQSCDPELILKSAVIALVMSAVYIIIGYHFYKNDDLN